MMSIVNLISDRLNSSIENEGSASSVLSVVLVQLVFMKNYQILIYPGRKFF